VLAQTDNPEADARMLAEEIAQNAPLSIEETRATLRGELAELVRNQTRLEFAKQQLLAKTDDFAEGLNAVRERRSGNFQRR